MAIIVRHRLLSQKTQSAIAGIISKNEWNDTHYVEPIEEVNNILWNTTSGHNHDGTTSRIGEKTNTLNDSYLGSSNYRYASKYPQANEIPILDANGYMNIRRVGSTQYSKIIFTNGTTPKATLQYDFIGDYIQLSNLTGTGYIQLTGTGEIDLIPKSSASIVAITSNFNFRNTVATDNSQVRLNFYDMSWNYGGFLGYNYHSTAANNALYLANVKSGGNGSYIALGGAGDIILNARSFGKVYYIHNDASATTNDEVATLGTVSNEVTSQLTTYGARVQGNPIGFNPVLPYPGGGHSGDTMMSGKLYIPRTGKLTIMLYGGAYSEYHRSLGLEYCSIQFTVGGQSIREIPPLKYQWWTMTLNYTGAVGLVDYSLQFWDAGSVVIADIIYGISYSEMSA